MQCNRIIIPGTGTDSIKRTVEHADDIGRLIADDGVLLLVPQYRHGYAATVLRIGVQIELIEELILVELIAGRILKTIIERPAILQHQRMHYGDIDHAIKALQLTHQQRAVRPGAGQRDIKMIAVAFGDKSRFTHRASTAIRGNPVAESRL